MHGDAANRFGTIPKGAEIRKEEIEREDQVKRLEQEVLDLKIVNKGKDFLIDQMRSDRDRFITELMQSHRRVGELEAKVLQLGGAGGMPNSQNPQPESAGGPSRRQ